MKAFFRILIILAILFIAFAIYITTRPSEYTIEKTKRIKAPISVVFNTVNEYKTWKDWGPWRENDDTFTSDFPDKTMGLDASYSWDSRLEGRGSIKTVDIKEYEFIHQKIVTDRRGESVSNFKFEREKDSTKVTWVKKGKLDFSSKLFFLFVGDIEDVFGQGIEDALQKLESYTEKVIDKHSFKDSGVVEYGGGYFIHLTTECAFDEKEAELDRILPEVLIYAIRQNYPRAGHIFTLYHKYDEENKRVMFSSCIPVSERVNPDGDIALARLESGRYYKTTYQGAYKYLDKAWEKAFEFVKKAGYTVPEKGKPFEVYTKGHTVSPNPADWVTEIYLPIE